MTLSQFVDWLGTNPLLCVASFVIAVVGVLLAIFLYFKSKKVKLCLYDTNRLIDAYRESERIDSYTTILNLIEFPKAMEFNLRVLFPSKSDYHLALIISTGLIKVDKPMPAVDSAIAGYNEL